jgi:hypothetical protein
MREAHVGRVLVASLHQGISDVLPARLGFYEQWLHVDGMREGSVGVAALHAVLSFLRREGDAYTTTTRCAGVYAAEWTHDAMTAFERAFIAAAPGPLRRRLLLRAIGRLVTSTFRDTRTDARIRSGTARIGLQGSIFCTVREPVRAPLCGYYAAALERLLELSGDAGRVEIVSCRGTGGGSCVLEIVRSQTGARAETSVEAA